MINDGLVQMKSRKQSSSLKIRDSGQAAVFSHPMRCRILLACAVKEQSLSQLQRQFGLSFSKIHYHVTRLVASGLLIVSNIEPRAGRPVRYYLAVSRAFVVPQAALPRPMSEFLAKELRLSLANLSRRCDFSMLYTVDDSGRQMIRVLDAQAQPDRSRAVEFWKVARLSRAQRASLARDMAALIARYDAASAGGAGAETFLIHAAFAPRLAR